MIHPGVFVFNFINFLLGCSSVAYVMAEDTNVGVAVVVADITPMCGLESYGVVALRSAAV